MAFKSDSKGPSLYDPDRYDTALPSGMNYVLITAARKEERNIERTLRCVIEQTQRPERWVILDDGSTDRTPEIVTSYAAKHPWIVLVRQPQRSDRSFAGKANAVNDGITQVQDLAFEVMGNLDADARRRILLFHSNQARSQSAHRT